LQGSLFEIDEAEIVVHCRPSGAAPQIDRLKAKPQAD
jgi:hypothetical protein